MCKAAAGVYTRAVEHIDADLDHERDQAWQAYLTRLDQIAERAVARKRPHYWRYLEQVAHARGNYEQILTDVLDEITQPRRRS